MGPTTLLCRCDAAPPRNESYALGLDTKMLVPSSEKNIATRCMNYKFYTYEKYKIEKEHQIFDALCSSLDCHTCALLSMSVRVIITIFS